MEKVLNEDVLTQLVARLARSESRNEEYIVVLITVLELLIRILVVKLKHKTYD